MEKVEINGCILNADALNFIKDSQDDNSEGFNQMKETLSLLLVDLIQQGFGDENKPKYLTVLADAIQFTHLLSVK